MRFLFLLIGCSISLCAQPSPEEALQRLISGNKRFISEQSEHPNRSSERRLETARMQEPFAAILGCSDSRVSPEILFDQGIGDLFIVRVAGNVVSPVELASIEFSAIYLHSALIVVLGHENCGAVQAVLDGNTKDIEPIANLIQPAVDAVGPGGKDRVKRTIQKNVTLMVEQLKQNPALQELIEQKQLRIVGGYYNFHTGKVEFLQT